MTDKVCGKCRKPKAATPANFSYSSGKNAALKRLRSTCRECIRQRDRARPPRNYSKNYKPTQADRDRTFAQSKKICSECQNMAWRRPFDGRCKCNGVHAAEPKPELMLRRHFERAS